MAEEWGFEPQRPVTDLLAFQASPFNHLGIPPGFITVAFDIIAQKAKMSLTNLTFYLAIGTYFSYRFRLLVDQRD